MIRTQTESDLVNRAIRAADRILPPRVYVPLGLRQKKIRLEGRKLRTRKPSLVENLARINDADPVGFLIAVMEGQPLPNFIITPDATGFEITVGFEIPTVQQRLNAAAFLGTRAMPKPEAVNPKTIKEKPLSDWDMAVKQAAAGETRDTDSIETDNTVLLQNGEA
jgi:hypothetical protein